MGILVLKDTEILLKVKIWHGIFQAHKVICPPKVGK